MFHKALAGFLVLASLAPLPALAQDNWRENSFYMRLKDRLDRPQDGYCIDIVGVLNQARFDMPLIGHNCKNGFVPDETVRYREDGTLFFPAYRGCVTAMGLNHSALPGAALMVKACGGDGPFLNATRFQGFDFRDDGKMALRESNLCISMGDQSLTTYDVTHTWRTLFLADCDTVEPALSEWEFVTPYR